MRVLMLDGGDRTPYLSRLVARLAARGFTIHYVGDPRWKDFPALGVAGVACHDLQIKSKLDLRARRTIRRLLAEHGIEVLHTITSRDAYVGLKARPRGQRIRTYVRRGAYTPLSRWDPADRLIYGRKGAERVVTVSRDLARHLVARGLAADRVTTIYTGIWSEELAPTKQDLRAAHGIDPGVFLLGFVGNWRPIKGFDHLLDALALLARRGAAFHLLVAGEGYGGQQAEVAERGLQGRVTFLGLVPDIRAFTPNVDCLVLSSNIDALPRAAIEATVLGTPVIARRVGGLPEILDEGRCGVLVEPGRPAALADALAEAIADPAPLRAMAAAAQERNRALFSLDGCVEAYDRLWRGEKP